MKKAVWIALSVAVAVAFVAPAVRAADDEDGYDSKDFSKSHLKRHWFQPFCDYPWTRTLCFERERKAPHRTLKFYCAPVTTHLFYPELYPHSYVAGGTINVDY